MQIPSRFLKSIMRNARRMDTATARCPITEGSGPRYLPLQETGGVRPCMSVLASCSRALSSPSAAGSQNSPLAVTRMRRVLTLSTHLLCGRRLTQANASHGEEPSHFENGNDWHYSPQEKSGEPSYGSPPCLVLWYRRLSLIKGSGLQVNRSSPLTFPHWPVSEMSSKEGGECARPS